MISEIPMSPVPMTENEKIPLYNGPDSDRYITPRHLLASSTFGNGRYFLYEGVCPSAILGNTQKSALFHGLPDEVALPYLLCRGSKAAALIAMTEGDWARLGNTKDFISEHFPHLPLYNTTHLLGPFSLKELTVTEQLEYLFGYLPNVSADSLMNLNATYFQEYPININLPEDPEKQDMLSAVAWCDFDDEMDVKIDYLLELLKCSLSKDTGASFSTLPLERVMGELGIEGDYITLLQEKRLLEHGQLLKPTPFGRQCGLVVRLKNQGRHSSLTDRELRVVPCAAEAFKEAVSFNRAVSVKPRKEAPQTKLSDRLGNLENWQFSSNPDRREALPKIRGALTESLKKPIGKIRGEKTSLKNAKLIDSFIDELKNDFNTNVDRQTSFHTLINECLRLLKSQKNAKTYTDLETGPEDSFNNGASMLWSFLYELMIIIREGNSPLPRASGTMSGGILERLRQTDRLALPCTKMPVSSYFQAIASLFDGTYPLWVCEKLGLPELLRGLDVPPHETIAAMLSKIWYRIETKDLNRLTYMMFVRPLSLLPDIRQAVGQPKHGNGP